MGACCARCTLAHTCCNCWCGLCIAYVTRDFDKQTVLDGESSLLPQNSQPRSKEDLLRDMENWKTGDLILQHRDSSRHSIIATNSPWTHVGLVYRRSDGKSTGADGNEIMILTLTDDYGNESANVLSFEALQNNYHPVTGDRHLTDRVVIQDAKKWMHVAGADEFYIAHRSLKQPLSKQQLSEFEESCKRLRGIKMGGFGIFNPIDDDSWEALQAAIDLECCFCCYKQPCHIRQREDLMFCSKAVGIVLQDVGLLDKTKMPAYELMPGDFDDDRIVLYSTDGEDPFQTQKKFYAFNAKKKD